VVLADGRIQQIGRPIELYHSPVNRFVAGFIGTPSMNFLLGHIQAADGKAIFKAEGGQVAFARADHSDQASYGQATLGIRPEDLRIVTHSDQAASPGDDTLVGRVVLVERLGGTSHVHFDLGPHRMMVSVSTDALPDVGENITVRVPAERVHLFGANGVTLR
jgi:ABC-type sugar transport system ATPase subunit